MRLLTSLLPLLAFWGRVLAVVCIPVSQYANTEGNLLALLFAPLALLITPGAAAVLLALSVCNLVLFSPAMPLQPAVFHGLMTAALALFAFCGQGIDLGEEGSRRYRILSSAARHGDGFFAAGIFVLLLLCCFRSVYWPVCMAWVVNFAIVRHGLRPLRGAPPSVKAGIVTLLSVLVSALLTLLLLEGGVRLLLDPGSDIETRLGTNEKTWMVPHPRRIIDPAPNTPGIFRLKMPGNKVERVPFNISSQGLRDREYGPKSAEEFRILMLGDSFAMGWGLSAEGTLERRIEDLFVSASRVKRLVVINGGVHGYGPWQQRDWLQEVGFRLEPNLVLHQLFPTNDVSDTLNRVGKHTQSYNEHRFNVMAKYTYRNHWQFKVQTAIEQRWHTYLYLSEMLPGQKAGRIVRLLNDIRCTEPCTFPHWPPSADRPCFLEVNLCEWYPELEEGHRLMEQDILGTRSDCAARGIGYIAFVVPSNATVVEGDWEQATGAHDEYCYERGKSLRRTEAFLAAQGIPFVPLEEALRKAVRRKPLYFRRDGHFNPEGAQVVAGLLAGYLRENYFPRAGL